MGMLKHENKNKLVHTPNVEVKNQIKREDVIKDNEITTFSTTLRVNNHIRNQLSALVSMGVASSTKELLNRMIQKEFEELDDDSQDRYKRMLNILEQRDYIAKN